MTMAKRHAQLESGAPAKRHKGPGADCFPKKRDRFKEVLESLLQCEALAVCGADPTLPGERGVTAPKEPALEGCSMPECSHCTFHRSHGASSTVSANDIRQRVSPWAWADVKKLLHRRCVHSLSVQHSRDGERVLLRGFLHVPHDDVEVCSCNGTPNAARVARAAATATAAAGGKNAALAAVRAGGAAFTGVHGGGSSGGAVMPGTCGPADRFGHVVEVMLSTEDWSITACSASCCGVGYDALQSQFCPCVGAVLLASRMGGGAAVLCEQDIRILTQMAQSAASAGPRDVQVDVDAAAPPGAAGAGSELLGAEAALGLGPPTAARLLAAVSRGSLVLGSNHVDPPPPAPASLLPGPGLLLGLQRELDCPRCVPSALRPHLIPSSRLAPAAAAGGAGPSTSTAPSPLVSGAPPVPPPHVPAPPAAEPGSGGNVRYQGGYSVGSYPSATARTVFAEWYREGASVAITTDRYRETFRMLLPSEEPAAPGASAAGPLPRQSVAPLPLTPAWAFGSGGGSVSLELTGETPQRFIASRAAERGPVWEARMALLSSSTALELDPELRLHTGASDAADPWPPVVIHAFDEASCPVGSPPGSNGPAGALCCLLRVTWLCLHVWDLDAWLTRRVKLVVQAICKLLLAADHPAYLRAASARLLGSWRLRVGEAAAVGRRPGYGSSNDVALTELLTRLNLAYILARDGWDAPHLRRAMGTASGSSAPAATATENTAAGGIGGGGGDAGAGDQAGAAVPVRGGTAHLPTPGRTVRVAGVGYGPAAAGAAPTLPDLQPTWIGFRPANQAAARRAQQQLGENPGGASAGAGVQLMLPGPRGVDNNGVPQPVPVPVPAMPFVPYAPPPLQGVVHTATSGLQEVTERLQWLGHFGLDGPYVSLAAASGEWSKAIKMLLRRGAKSDVERACRLAVERLSSAAAKAQQACFLLHQVRGPPAQTKGTEAGAEAATWAAGTAAGGGAEGGGAAVGQPAAEPGAGGAGMDSLVVSAVAQLPPTFVAGCAARMFMSAVRAALNMKLGASDGSSHANPSNATFEMSFLRANPNPLLEGVSPAAALLAAISPNTAGGAGATRPSPYTALLRSVIAMVAENQEREWRAEEDSLREAGLLEEPRDGQDRTAEGHQGAGAASGKEGNGTVQAEAGTAAGGGSGATGGDGGGIGGGSAEEGHPQRAASNYAEYIMATLAAIAGRHNPGAAAMQRRDLMADQCDCDACRRERRERLAHMESELPPGTVQFTRLRPEDACFVSDPAALVAFSRVLPLSAPRVGGGRRGRRVHSLAVQVVRSVFRPVLATLADPQDKPRGAAEYATLLATVEESMATLCDDFMPERVQLQAVLEGVTCALCILYCCHHAAGANPAALGRVVTELLGAGQLALARQVAACQLSMIRSPDSLAHTLEVAVAGGEEAQREMALELLRMAAREPPPEQRLAAARAGRPLPDHGLPPGMLPGIADMYRAPPYMDDSDDYDTDDPYSDDMMYELYSPPISDVEDELYEDHDMFNLHRLYGMLDHEFAENRRRRRDPDRVPLRADRRAAAELERHANGAADMVVDLTQQHNSGSEHDSAEGPEDSRSDESGDRRRRGHGTAAAAAQGGGDGDDSASDAAESNLDTADVLAGRRRGADSGAGGAGGSGGDEDGEEVIGPGPIGIGPEEAERRRIRAEKSRAGATPPSRRRSGDVGAGGSGGGAGHSAAAAPRPNRRRHEDTLSKGRAMAVAGEPEENKAGREATQEGPAAVVHRGLHDLAVNMTTLAVQVLHRRLVRAEADQNMFALAQYIRGRGAVAELVAPLMACSVVGLDALSPNACSNSMFDFANDMLSLRNTPPLRHASRLEGRAPDSPCLKGLPASSWQSFVTARNYRYGTTRDEGSGPREVVVVMDYRDPLVLTAWVCAAYSSDLAGRRRVLAAMTLAASRKYGPSMAHLGLALARSGLNHAAVVVAARALAPCAVRYSAFTSNANSVVPAVGQIWYPACLLELAPVFVEVLGQVAARQVTKAGEAASTAASPHEPGANAKAGGAGTSAAAGESLPKGEAEEAAAAAVAEAEGRGVGEWRVPPMELADARAAVANLAVTLLLLRCELPSCLLGCAEAVTAVMALLSRVATGCGVKHEQLFEGGGVGSVAHACLTQLPGTPVHELSGWVVVAMRECLLGPLRSAPREVQQGFVTAVAAMPDNELDFKMKIPLLEWARGARVPVATIFDAASRAVNSATRSLDVEATIERSALLQALRELTDMGAGFGELRAPLVYPHGGYPQQQQQHLETAIARARQLGILSDSHMLTVRREMELALAVSNGQGGIEAWIEDKLTPSSASSVALRPFPTGASYDSAAVRGHRSWVWHVLKWLGERLVEEMGAAAPPGPQGALRRQPLAATLTGSSDRGSSRQRRTTGGGGTSASRDTSPSPSVSAAGAAASTGRGGRGPLTDPRSMLQQLVERTGTFRGPELLPLACTLLDVVAKEGPGSDFAAAARALLTRSILTEAGRSVALATNDAWRSSEYRAGLRRILGLWKAECEALEQQQPHQAHQQQPGRPRRASSGHSAANNSATLTDDLAEKVALTLVLSEGSVASLQLASSVLDRTRPAGAADAADQAAALPSPRSMTGSRGATGAGAAAAAKSSDQPPARLELRFPVQRGGVSGASCGSLGSGTVGPPGGGLHASSSPHPLQPGATPMAAKPAPAPAPAAAGGHAAGAGRRGRGSAAAASAAAASPAYPYLYPEPPHIGVVDEGWEDRGQQPVATMPSGAAGWDLEPLSLHGALRPVLMLGAIDLPRDDPRVAATLRFLQVQAVPPADAVATALAPLGLSTEGTQPNPAGAAAGSSGSADGGGGGYSNCMSRNYSPRYSAAVWRLVLQLMRRDAALLSCWRAASAALDNVHLALQVGTHALAPGTSAARILTWQRRMEAPAAVAASSLSPAHVRCAVAVLRVWIGSRWLLGSCQPPVPQPQAQGLAQELAQGLAQALGEQGAGGGASAAGGAGPGGAGAAAGGPDIPPEEKEPAVAMLVDDLQRLCKLNADLALDCIRDNATKYAQPPQQQQQPPPGAVGAAQPAGTMQSRYPTLGGAQPPNGPAVAGASAGAGTLGSGSALLSEEEVGRLNRLEGFVAALGEHMKADPLAKKVLFALQPRLPQLHDKVLRFLYKNRNSLTRESLVAKLVRDFNMAELDQLRATHLPWTPVPIGTKAMRAAELAEWICEHQNEYLEQQGRPGMMVIRRRYDIHYW